MKSVQMCRPAADDHHQGGGTGHFRAVTPGAVDVVGVKADAAEPAPWYEAERPWPGKEVESDLPRTWCGDGSADPTSAIQGYRFGDSDEIATGVAVLRVTRRIHDPRGGLA